MREHCFYYILHIRGKLTFLKADCNSYQARVGDAHWATRVWQRGAKWREMIAEDAENQITGKALLETRQTTVSFKLTPMGLLRIIGEAVAD
ncbi:MAG: hypothetical protein WCL11_18675 [Verrucomicrobiota bacterium]